MGYISTLSQQQKENIQFIIKKMNESGITNPYTQAGILAVISKESSFIPKSETSYSGTSNDRIRSIFSRTKPLSDSALTTMKADPKAFFDFVYDGKIGNGVGEGYKFRGRGLNQLTGRANYESHNEFTQQDIVKNPDKLNEFPVAVDVVIGYFKRAFTKAGNKLSEYGMKDYNDAKSVADGVGAAYHANTGWGKTKAQIDKESTGGHKKAIARAPEFFDLTKSQTASSQSIGLTIDKKKILITTVVVVVLVSSYLVLSATTKLNHSYA